MKNGSVSFHEQCKQIHFQKVNENHREDNQEPLLRIIGLGYTLRLHQLRPVANQK